jgi:hypothetical protein
VIVDIGDVPVLLSADEGRRSDALLRHLGAGRAHAGPAQATIRYESVGPPTPPEPPVRTIEDVRVWHEGDRLLLLHASGASADVRADEAWIGGPVEDVDPVFHRLLLLVLTHVLAHHQRFVLHAASVVPASSATVVLGDTGQGKSTVAAAALAAGWPVLGDDMVVARLDRDGVEVAGVARPGALPGDVAVGTPLADDPRGRVHLSPAALTPGWFPVGTIARVAHGAGVKGELRPLAAQQVLYSVMSGFAAAITPPLLRAVLPVAAALSRRPAFELRLGTDPATRGEDAVALLASTP